MFQQSGFYCTTWDRLHLNSILRGLPARQDYLQADAAEVCRACFEVWNVMERLVERPKALSTHTFRLLGLSTVLGLLWALGLRVGSVR